jgi:hypothetical protein
VLHITCPAMTMLQNVCEMRSGPSLMSPVQGRCPPGRKGKKSERQDTHLQMKRLHHGAVRYPSDPQKYLTIPVHLLGIGRQYLWAPCMSGR